MDDKWIGDGRTPCSKCNPNGKCPVCNDLGYIEYKTGVEHGGFVEIAKEICGCQKQG